MFAGVAAGPPVALDDGAFVTFMGRYQPTGPGYALVVPKRHVRDLHDLEPHELGPMLDTVRRVSLAVIAGFGVTGTTIMQNNGEPAQRVKHLHFHVVPRAAGDGYPRETREEVELAELNRQAEILRRQLRERE